MERLPLYWLLASVERAGKTYRISRVTTSQQAAHLLFQDYRAGRESFVPAFDSDQLRLGLYVVAKLPPVSEPPHTLSDVAAFDYQGNPLPLDLVHLIHRRSVQVLRTCNPGEVQHVRQMLELALGTVQDIESNLQSILEFLFQ